VANKFSIRPRPESARDFATGSKYGDIQRALTEAGPKDAVYLEGDMAEQKVVVALRAWASKHDLGFHQQAADEGGRYVWLDRKTRGASR